MACAGSQRGNDALGAAEKLESLERLRVGHADVRGTLRRLQVAVLRADARIVQARRDAVRLDHLAVRVLQQVRQAAVQHPRLAGHQRRGVLVAVDARSAGLDADQLHRVVRHERVEQADGVAAAADARDRVVGQPPRRLHELLSRLAADDRLEVADQHGVGVGPHDAADQVVRRLDVRDPVADRLVDRVLERPAAGGYGPHLGAQQPHPEHVQRLAADVLLAHVDDALLFEHRAHRRRSDAVLACAGLGDDPLLAHALRQQALAHGVVDLVRAGVRQVLALEVDLRPAQLPRQVLRVVERRRAADVRPSQAVEVLGERIVVARLPIDLLQLLQGVHERLGDEPSSEVAEVAGLVGQRHRLRHPAVSFAPTSALAGKSIIRQRRRRVRVHTRLGGCLNLPGVAREEAAADEAWAASGGNGWGR